jgi:hypothetical protein
VEVQLQHYPLILLEELSILSVKQENGRWIFEYYFWIGCRKFQNRCVDYGTKIGDGCIFMWVVLNRRGVRKTGFNNGGPSKI